MKYQFIDQQRRYHCVEKMASVLGVSRSGYYAWRNREPSEHGKRDGILVSEIRRIQEGVAKHRYGSPRMTKELQRRSFVVGHNRVAKLMRANGLNARQRNKFRTTTMSGHKHEAAPNIVDRSFTPQRPNQVWASEATYIATAEGWLYLFVIIDLFSRRVIGWSISKSLSTTSLLQAFWMAVQSRGGAPGLVFHSDRGVQYASRRFRNALKKRGFIQSMSRKGNCWDNACVESFFKSMKSELIGRTVFPSRAVATQKIFEYIEVFYNRLRLHSTLAYCSPIEYEEEAKSTVA